MRSTSTSLFVCVLTLGACSAPATVDSSSDPALDRRRVEETRSELLRLDDAVGQFAVDHANRLPHSLAELTTECDELGEPYWSDDLLDPWGRPYRYDLRRSPAGRTWSSRSVATGSSAERDSTQTSTTATRSP